MQKRFFGRQRILVTFTILIALSTVFSQFINVWNAQAAGTITGRVFQDFNGNGAYDTASTIANTGFGTIGVAIDRGIQNVTVTAYDAAGVMRGSTTTCIGLNNPTAFCTGNNNGAFSLNAAGTGPYRVEFTNLPAGYFPSARSTDSVLAGMATGAGSTVQFVNDGATANVNLAVNHPADYSQNNPEVIASMYSSGDQLSGVNSNLPVLVSFPYSAGSTDTAVGASEPLFDMPSANPLELYANEIGTTYGLTYARQTRRIYAAAFFKRHAGFGPGGPNRIYVIDRTGNGSVAGAFTVPGTATKFAQYGRLSARQRQHRAGTQSANSLGGIALSDDETTLYVMNLANRTLYELNRSTGAQITSQATLTDLPVRWATAAPTDRRPFARRFIAACFMPVLFATANLPPRSIPIPTISRQRTI